MEHPTIENGHFDRYSSFKFPKVVKLAKISLLIQIDPSSNLVRSKIFLENLIIALDFEL